MKKAIKAFLKTLKWFGIILVSLIIILLSTGDRQNDIQ